MLIFTLKIWGKSYIDLRWQLLNLKKISAVFLQSRYRHLCKMDIGHLPMPPKYPWILSCHVIFKRYYAIIKKTYTNPVYILMFLPQRTLNRKKESLSPGLLNAHVFRISGQEFLWIVIPPTTTVRGMAHTGGEKTIHHWLA